MRTDEVIIIQSPHSTVNTFVPGLLLHHEAGSQKSVASLAMMPDRQDS